MNRILTHTVVVGAGIAGSWLAYRLAQHGVPVVVLSAAHHDTPTVSLRAATVFDRRLVETADRDELAQVFVDETATQHPELQPMMRRYLHREFAELSKLVPFQTLETMLIPHHPVPFPRLGAGGEVIAMLHQQIRALGGQIITGRVTDLLVEDGVCRGVSCVHAGEQLVIQSSAVVLASGGYSGLMPHSHTPNSGSMLGLFASVGGELTNLEFSQRHALGDLTAGRVLYPPDLAGAQFYRAGQRAVWLERAYATMNEERRDLEIFQQYWRSNGQVSHTLERGDENYALGPIYGLSMGGIAHNGSITAVAGVYATGEARHDIVADAIIGRPWAIYICTSGMLAETLKTLPEQAKSETLSAPLRNPDVQAGLCVAIRRRLHAFEDHRFSESAVHSFVEWCRRTRRELPDAQNSDSALLILAESYARSALLRRESRGYFYRADFPTTDPSLSQLRTFVRYDRADDTVHAELRPHRSADEGP
ncbi:FAD-binding protein [Nocardia sp. NPDC049707]|uniref:FAD-binding protein n=1 Tax=Nocardia sp. NPDC049707 TaxID=3154735 RepID=UPI003425D7E6